MAILTEEGEMEEVSNHWLVAYWTLKLRDDEGDDKAGGIFRDRFRNIPIISLFFRNFIEKVGKLRG